MSPEGDFLDVSALHVRYGQAVALEDVSLRVDPGARLAIVGRNGAGKSTLLNAIVGVVPTRSGSIQGATPTSWSRRSQVAVSRDFEPGTGPAAAVRSLAPDPGVCPMCDRTARHGSPSLFAGSTWWKDQDAFAAALLRVFLKQLLEPSIRGFCFFNQCI